MQSGVVRHPRRRHELLFRPNPLDEISANVAPGAHAVLVLDQAGWHTTGNLKKPSNITFLPMPPRSPELNPAENA